ncbi:helix-turn-helix transcriptional regulator [Rhodovastum atsumiense]|uniref:Shikimate kinase n=2 Tax=Rhodovastum atsumiense TaxID=504468 RepID=A0A5M6IU26_9PROT|nr:helix-turn-helix transcriptional regulator [Rhodovastum atsumiense]KAA5611721.1 helix-turn-helix transcriptional regulator [Rhodovastum atsumiense]
MTRRQAAMPEAADTDSGDPVLQALASRLRLLRARRAMTRRALARQSRVSERYIAQLEAGTGNASLVLLHRIAAALGVPVGVLLQEVAEPPPELLPVQRLLERLSPAQLAEARHLLAERFLAVRPDLRRQRIALVGLRGAGKSTLGRRLAGRRGVPFHELDREIEREAAVELREIFEMQGQAAFRRLERAALDRLLAGPGGMVIATGGSLVTEPDTYETLLAHCRVVWIRTSPDEHMRRVVEQGDLRPIRDSRQAMRDLKSILASRESLYARADLVLDTSGQDEDRSFRDLLDLLEP